MQRCPRNWRSVKLGALLGVQNGFAFSSDHFDKNDGIPLIRIRDLKNGSATEVRYRGPYQPEYIVRTGDLLIGMDGEFRCYEWRGREALLNQRVCRLVNFSDEIDPEFVRWGIDTHLRLIEESTPFVTVKHLSSKAIRAIDFAYPERNEQRRIVGRIKECMERIEEIEALDFTLVQEALALFPALLNQRFQGLAASIGRTRLDEVADIRGGASLPKGQSEDGGSKSVLLLKVGDMNEAGNERVVASSRAYLPIAQAGRGVINAGATIFPKRGGAIATNKKRLLARPALLDPNLMAIEPSDDQVLAGYLYYWSLTLDLRAIASGAIIPQLNRKDLAPLQLPVPDRHVQEALVTELEEAEAACVELIAQVRASRGERASLREAILRKAFAGEL